MSQEVAEEFQENLSQDWKWLPATTASRRVRTIVEVDVVTNWHFLCFPKPVPDVIETGLVPKEPDQPIAIAADEQAGVGLGREGPLVTCPWSSCGTKVRGS